MKLQTTNRSNGFTIIEVVLVAVVLCVLSALIILTASGVQAKNRNGERQTHIDIIRGQIESYFAQNDKYPTLNNLNDPAWRKANLPRIKDASLQDPRWSKKTSACTVNNQAVLSESPRPNCYSYQVVGADGKTCYNDGPSPCLHYTLTANLEGGETYAKTSLN